MRREVEEHRRRASEYLEEAGELRKERDALKLERNEMLINNARAVEEERAQKRALVGENDKLRYQLKCAEESLQAAVIKCDKKQQELNTAQHEKNSYQTLLREKEIMNESLRRQTTELNEELRDRDRELRALQTSRAEAEQAMNDNSALSRATKQIETLEKNFA